ncbi:MAG: hypothetical protein HZB26_17935, partial [Candidatus Hydrogenedentes bacterium]|nr:hypothetical protein [Candidatus Hydrogenedentota bacterium]
MINDSRRTEDGFIVKRLLTIRPVLVSLLVCLLAATASEPSPFQMVTVAGQPRAVALDPDAKTLYLALYDRDEVIRVDIASRETLGTARVGKGPASLALSTDGTTLACVNRLASSLTVLKVPELTIVGTVPCGNGATSVAAVADHGFAVANAFADSITLVDPSDIHQ